MWFKSALDHMVRCAFLFAGSLVDASAMITPVLIRYTRDQSDVLDKSRFVVEKEV